ncbi:MAG: hypothetical protein ACRDD8_16460 [Bacteroidales bacterium]
MILKTEKRDRIIGLIKELREIDKKSGKNRIEEEEYDFLDLQLSAIPDNGKIDFFKWVAFHILGYFSAKIIELETLKK